ncbi:hypothetical protein BDV93DRAFT_51206 [Ceratobasidium sp. AG-I]|nr:hypothetical protein BDV93DRAFT_51206 [Ceratobasidium sp. AG-I]
MLGISIAQHTKSLHSAFKPHHFDWLKVLRYVSQLPFMSLPSSRPLLPYIEQLVSAWKTLGEEVGYPEHNHLALPCSYTRCPGFEIVSHQSFACGQCLYATYCSPRCQQADWMYGGNPHSELCGEYIGDTKLIEGA